LFDATSFFAADAGASFFGAAAALPFVVAAVATVGFVAAFGGAALFAAAFVFAASTPPCPEQAPFPVVDEVVPSLHTLDFDCAKTSCGAALNASAIAAPAASDES
jgi:hypothetical protein